ncbi:hypothetical protein [Actinophytocola sp. NPDC049390]|uniref:Rv1733c family protein n=1 Tax=Actinophytocola sp. NPDC049390 TaxID=3363894 RepID=UPI0037BC7935
MSTERPAGPSLVLRLARLVRPGGNPLARGVDRAEGTAVILFILLALVLVPVLLTLGSETYSNLAERGERQAATRHETVAVLTENAPVASVGAQGDGVRMTPKVAAHWQLPDGTFRTGLVDAETGMKAGAEVPVWLDRSGRAVDPPVSSADAVVGGVLVAVSGWLVVAGLCALFCRGVHHALDRRRYRAWETEWARVEPEWDDQHR